MIKHMSFILLCSGSELLFTFGFECPNTCGTPADLPFCSQISYGVCSTKDDWETQDQDAELGYNLYANRNESLLKRIPKYANLTDWELFALLDSMNLDNTSSSCGQLLKQIHCAVTFPVCEIGRTSKRLCMSSCSDVAMSICPELEQVCHQFSPNEIETKEACFKIHYKGPSMGMWIAGFLIAFIFSIFNSIGINLQKLSMTRNEAAKLKKKSFQQPLWLLGFSLVCVGSILDFVAFGMAPQTLLAPLAALSLVWNMMIAPFFHDEKVTKQSVIATVIIFIGVILTVIFAGHSTPEYELKDLIDLYQQPAMYAYMFFVFVFLAALFALTKYIEKTHNFEGGIYHIVCYGGIAGTFGGQSVLLAKSTVELLKSAIWGAGGAGVFTNVAPYLILCGLIICLVFQVFFLNGGLARFDALVVVPVYQSFWILMSVLGGITYFAEYVSMTKTSLYMFTLGALITISGIIYLLKSRNSENSSQYTDLSVTPISAWNTDDSDEEEIQLKLANKWEEIDIGGASSSKVVPISNAKSSNLNADISAAIYRTMPVSNKRPNDRNAAKRDDDAFF
uniref:Uncharacterized protein AlNc14C13G1576 n=1 Tax=Albugo laibachii Nc14 TaxID=890382 RepID=F0W3L4_9STRA|nr:conserved hypothetical protein [Albugo laibachii Nc14]CCA16279.1 conserved hypothetical protein [Albugo laibachii Nc14]|eukprot:CCA16279.1 conserved hypothetical protein [Albugo laibachii Nc14]